MDDSTTTKHHPSITASTNNHFIPRVLSGKSAHNTLANWLRSMVTTIFGESGTFFRFFKRKSGLNVEFDGTIIKNQTLMISDIPIWEVQTLSTNTGYKKNLCRLGWVWLGRLNWYIIACLFHPFLGCPRIIYHDHWRLYYTAKRYVSIFKKSVLIQMTQAIEKNDLHTIWAKFHKLPDYLNNTDQYHVRIFFTSIYWQPVTWRRVQGNLIIITQNKNMIRPQKHIAITNFNRMPVWVYVLI